MNLIEYKRINWMFSISDNIKNNISQITLNEQSILFITKLKRDYNSIVKTKIDKVETLNEKKMIIHEFLQMIPSQLLILRNHLKNCMYSNDLSDFKFKYEKYIKEDMERFNYIKM